MTVTREAVDRTSSLVPTPAVVAHRGASGHRPEHTLDAYRTAIRMGVDDIELDLVATRDGVLVARHDLELSTTTDVADRPGLAHLRRTLVVDGAEQHGWFVQDLTLPELKTLAARERMPGTRPGSAVHDGAEGVPTLTEVLAMVGAESLRRGRQVGVTLELKHAAHHDAAGLPRDRLTSDELDRIDEYADGLGAHTSLVLPRDPDGAIGAPSSLVRDAHRRGLTVHAWTVRAENRFLPTNLRRGSAPDALGDMAGEVRALLAAGVDAVITDHPDEALAVVREVQGTALHRRTLVP